MPTISRLYGIVIFINYNDHPHLTSMLAMQDQEVSVEIETGIVQGKMSRRALQMAVVREISARAAEKLGGDKRTQPPLANPAFSLREKYVLNM